MTDTQLSAPPTGSKERIDELNRRIDRIHHSLLDKDVLRGVLPLRAKTAAHRSAQPDVRERERRFRDVSSSYGRADADMASFARSTRVVTLDGLTWTVPLPRPDDAVLVERALGQQDFPYRAITQTREVAIGGTMIDVGANTGRMSIPRVILGDVSAAYCAEPDPLNYACLVANVRNNELAGLVLPDRLAIGSEDGTARFERGKSAGGHRVIGAETVTRHEVVEVPSLTLDTWVERLGIDLQQLVFVKVDVQGSEAHVLQGASRVLSCKHVAWQVEVDLPLLAKRGARPQDLFGLLRRNFTHFVDLSRHAVGERVRPMDQIGEALANVSGGSEGRTDVLAFTVQASATT